MHLILHFHVICLEKGYGNKNEMIPFYIACLFYIVGFSRLSNMMSWIKNNVTVFRVMDFMFVHDPLSFWYFAYTFLCVLCFQIKQKWTLSETIISCPGRMFMNIWDWVELSWVKLFFYVKLKGIFDCLANAFMDSTKRWCFEIIIAQVMKTKHNSTKLFIKVMW